MRTRRANALASEDGLRPSEDAAGYALASEDGLRPSEDAPSSLVAQSGVYVYSATSVAS